jgi:phospholipase B1
MFKFLILLIALVGLASAKNYFIDDYEKFIMALSSSVDYINDYEKNVQKLLALEPDYFDYTPFKKPDYTFDCDTKNFVSAEVPTSVHQLKPGDIKVVAALGDSLSAALGADAKTIVGLLAEYRGRSWSIGGKESLEKIVTMPNILKKFNPNLKGASTDLTLSLFTKEGSGLNAAVSGAEASDIPTQVQRLVQRFKESKDVDFNNDWKLVTLFIGGNDLCRFDKDRNSHSPASYVNDITTGIDILYKELPRAFVNLVSVLDAGQVRLLNDGLICTVLHKFVCSEAAFPSSPAYEKELEQVYQQYLNFTNNVVEQGRWDGREDFTVVLQPMFEEFKVPYKPSGEPDLSYFAPDCFHLSAKGHTEVAIGLWNNMLEKVGQKAKAWTPGDKIDCPTKENPYLFTAKNSK